MVTAPLASDEVELLEDDGHDADPRSSRSAPDPTATLPGSLAPLVGGAFDPRGSAPDLEDEEVPASQRQMRTEDRPLDDALEGVSEPPPESGEVESQRYTKVADEIEQTTEVRALASVDVVDRPPVDEGIAVASFSGTLASSRRPSFGEILDSALDL
jgi:hypothetical protein